MVEKIYKQVLINNESKMSYNNYSVEDFASDQKFREWVLNPDPINTFFWEKWIINNPEKRDLVVKARLLVSSFKYKDQKISKEEKKKLLEKIDNIIDSKEDADSSGVKVVPINSVFNQSYRKTNKADTWKNEWLKVAVVLVGIVLSSLFVIQIVTSENEANKKVVLIEKNNPAGRRSILLPDGSKVILNAKSKITYPATFNEDVREVTLSGEAFFDVKKDVNRPFFVKTNEMTTQVLGTTFNVKAYSGDKESEVCLVSGKVLIQKNKGKEESIILIPGEALGLDKETDIITKREFNYKEEILWKDGILYLNETPLDEVFSKLELSYDVSFQFNKKPKNMKAISGSFKNESLENILQTIGYTVRFEYDIDNKNVLIKFK